MSKWVVCKRCGHVFENSLDKCPECSKSIINSKTLITIITFSIVFIISILGVLMGLLENVDISKDSIDTASKENEKIVNQDLGNVLTGTVELTISKDMLTLFGEEFDYTLTQEQKDNGFIDIKKNEDGSATYTIKKKDYEKFIEELRAEAKNGIDELTADGTFTSIKKIEYTDDFEKITITANKEQFENGLDSLCIMSCGLTSCMYQMFDVDSSGKCTVEVKDVATGEIFKTTVYPDAMQEE